MATMFTNVSKKRSYMQSKEWNLLILAGEVGLPYDIYKRALSALRYNNKHNVLGFI